MIFASTIGEGVGSAILLLAIGCLAARKLLRESDKDGKIRGAASEGIVRMIGRFLR